MADLIFPYKILRLCFSLECNFKCTYCTMCCQKDLYRGGEYAAEEVSSDVWVKALKRIKPTRDMVVVPCNAEPAIFKGCADIVNCIPHLEMSLYTNCSTESLQEIKKMKPRDNLQFYVSYHRGQIPLEEFVENGKWLKNNFNVADFHAPEYPPIKKQLLEDKKKMEGLGIDLKADHPFLGWHNGKFHYSYLGEGAWIKKRLASMVHGEPMKTVLCKTSFDHKSYFSQGCTVAPNGDIYTCWRYLYTRDRAGVIGNLFDEEFQFKNEFIECPYYGDCNPCTWHKMIIDKKTGDILDNDITELAGGDTVSACLMVRDEEDNLPACLDSLKYWVDEIIIVDTGSKDRTIEIAKEYGAVVYEQPWEDDFSLHRNYSISKATKDWVFIIDADERVHPKDGPHLKRMLVEHSPDAFAVDILNMYGTPKVVSTRLKSIRLFKRSLGAKYVKRIHNELVVPAGAKIMNIPFRQYHIGYDLSPAAMAKKYERVKGMAKKLTEERPDDETSWYHYARALMTKAGQFDDSAADEIVSSLNKGINAYRGKEGPDKSVHIQTLNLMATVQYVLGNHLEASRYAQMALELKPDYLDAIWVDALANVYGIDANKGEKLIHHYLQEQKAYDFSAILDCIAMEHADEREQAYKVLIEIEQWKKKQALSELSQDAVTTAV